MDVTQLSIVLDPVSNRKVINDDYRIIRKIGLGQYGKVLLGEVIRNSRPSIDSKTSKTSKSSRNSTKEESVVINDRFVAIKTINRLDKSKLITKSYLSQTVKIKREIQIMKECSHPNVVKLYQVIDDLKFDKILLILEYCQYGEIDWKRYNHYYEKYKPLKRPLTINKILRDVVNGLEYLHSVKKIIHRDLKPSNLLITQDNTIKISDFGVSLILQNNHTDQKELSKTMGTPVFYAPELCQFVNNRLSMIHTSHIVIDERIDIWALGVVLYCLMFNDLPFNGFNEFELFKNIVRDDLKFPKIKHTSKTTDVDIKELGLLKDLIKKILVKDQDTRLSVQQIKLHEFTTFDLGSVERKKFLNFNQGVFKDNSNRERLESSKESGMQKLKRFFRSAPEPEKKEPPKINTNLEPVDDLLDSYLDDSSSFGSDEEVISNIDTNNILDNDLTSSVDESTNIHIPRSASNSMTEGRKRPTPLVLARSNKEPVETVETPVENTNKSVYKYSHKDKDNYKDNYKDNQDKDSFDNFDNLNPDISTSSLVSPATGSFNPPLTPTNNNTITIGAPSSAGSNKSVFSPSKRFFSRKKKAKKPEQKPTISSLSSPAKKGKNPAKKITDLMEPPPIFGLNAAYPSGSGNIGDSSLKSPISGPPSSIAKSFSDNSASTSRRSSPKSAINSRKNSMSSVGSGYGLMRITSSSSSLNLNAYLTDDNYSIASIQRPRVTVDSDTDHETTIEEPDETLIDDSIVRNFMSMNEYLDRLD